MAKPTVKTGKKKGQHPLLQAKQPCKPLIFPVGLGFIFLFFLFIFFSSALGQESPEPLEPQEPQKGPEEPAPPPKPPPEASEPSFLSPTPPLDTRNPEIPPLQLEEEPGVLKGYQPHALGLELGRYEMKMLPPTAMNRAGSTERGTAFGVYLEAYPYKKLGFGYKIIGTSIKDQNVGSTEMDVSLLAHLLTVQYVPFGFESPLRGVLLSGVGWGKLSGENEWGYTPTRTGPVGALGGYFNWGGENIHLRVGQTYIYSAIPGKSALQSKGTGQQTYASCSLMGFSADEIFLTVLCAGAMFLVVTGS